MPVKSVTSNEFVTAKFIHPCLVIDKSGNIYLTQYSGRTYTEEQKTVKATVIYSSTTYSATVIGTFVTDLTLSHCELFTGCVSLSNETP